MATALKEPRDAPENRPATDGTDNERADMHEEWAGDWPERYVVREIDFNMADNSLQFSFRNSDLAQPLPAGGIAEVIDGLRGPAPAPAAFFGAAAAAAARETPLDLNVIGTPIYIIFALSEPKNMTFSSRLKAMTHKKSADRDYYGGLRHVTATEESKDPLPGCKLIYFAVDPPVENPPVPPDDKYQHGFNFNVELEQDPKEPGGPKRIIELSIDPDVRHPGGSGT